jgi:hypothetical protein
MQSKIGEPDLLLQQLRDKDFKPQRHKEKMVVAGFSKPGRALSPQVNQ